MTAEGLPVPPGFVIASTAFEAAVDTDALRKLMRATDVDAARAMVSTAEPPREPIGRHYAELTGLVAVRSSACAEDSEAASYAGQQETYLNTDGLADVLANVVRCWLSFFTERAVFYRREKGSLDDVAMAVIVQEMVDSDSPGCCSPSTRSTAAGTAWSSRPPAAWARRSCPARSPRTTTRSAATGW